MKPAGEGLDRNETPAIGPAYNKLRSACKHRSGMIASGTAICGIASGRSPNAGVWIGDRFACAGKEGILFSSWLRMVNG